jgi:predicted dehydrogenase
MNGEIRWGILGPGRIAHKFAQAIANSPGMLLKAVGSRSLDHAEAFAAQHGAAKAHGSYEALASDPEVDVIYISTPHSVHFENIMLCLENSKSVLCEKPLCINAAQGRQVVQNAREKQIFLMEAMWTRFLPSAWHIRSWLYEKQIGEVRMLSADFGFQVPFNPQHRLFDPHRAGGALLDIGVYGIAYASMVFGMPPSDISSFALMGPTGLDEESVTIFRYPDGRMASLSCAIRTELPSEAHILGTEGSLHVHNFWKSDAIRRKKGDMEETLRFPYHGAGFEHEIAEVGRCLRDGKTESAGMTLDETLQNLDTMDRIRRVWGLKYPMETEIGR